MLHGQVISKFAAANYGQNSSKFATIKIMVKLAVNLRGKLGSTFCCRLFKPAVKTENFSLAADFSDFYLAVSASVNDAKHRKPNSFITHMTRDMGQKMLTAVNT